MPYRPSAAPVEAYIGPEWFEKEQNLLFRKLWQFFTFASLVDQPNKFVAKTLSGIPVVVQNFNGELRAFENACLHRQAPLQPEACGRRPLTCPYHGWNYGSDGRVTAIPFEEFYQFVPQQREELRLRSFALAKIGGLVFINLDPDPLPLEKQFSRQYLDSLAEVSLGFDREIIFTTFRRRFNWKLIFENLRDGLHAAFLHKQTLNRTVTFRPWMPDAAVWQAYLDERAQKDEDIADPFDEVRKYFSKGGPDAALDHINAYPWHEKVERYKADNSYYNWLTFPNLHIASTGGFSFTLEHYIPRTADETDIDVYCVLARRKSDIPESKALLFEFLKSTTRVLNEDFGMLAQAQAAMHSGAPPSHWGAFELRSHRIATWMNKVIDGRIAI